MKWYQNYKQIVAFCKIAYLADLIDTQEEIFTFLDDPKAYDEQYVQWVEYGQPEQGESGWDDFVAAVNGTEVEVSGD